MNQEEHLQGQVCEFGEMTYLLYDFRDLDLFSAESTVLVTEHREGDQYICLGLMNFVSENTL